MAAITKYSAENHPLNKIENLKNEMRYALTGCDHIDPSITATISKIWQEYKTNYDSSPRHQESRNF